MNTNSYRAEFSAYNSSLALARYQHHVGSEPEFRIDRLRVDYGDLFSRSAIADLQSQADGTRLEAETESAGIRGLLSAARLEQVELQAAETTRELASRESSTHVNWSGETLALADISFRLGSEPDKSRRDQLVRRWSDAVGPCEDLRTARRQLLHQSAADLGFVSYWDLIADATRANLNQVQRDGEDLLKETEAVHRLALSGVIPRELGAALASNLNFADLAYLERLPSLDKFFAARNWSTIYSDTMRLLGIRVDKQPNLQITFATPSPSVCPAGCFPVSPPDDVRLIVSPRGAADHFASSLHAAGLAQQHTWSSKNLAERHPEFIYSADSATSKGYGYLFSFLLLEPKWIQEFLPPISETQASELASAVASVLTLRVRRWAAETSYAMLLHSTAHSAAQSSLEQLQAAFVDLQTRALGFQFCPELFLLDLHERVSSASHLRALAFAAGLREYLRGRYGNRWWASRKAGDELIDLWNTASRYPVEELARLNGFEMSFEPITELLITNVRGARK